MEIPNYYIQALGEAGDMIHHLLSFLEEKAKESGDVAGLKANAQAILSSPRMVQARVVYKGIQEAKRSQG